MASPLGALLLMAMSAPPVTAAPSSPYIEFQDAHLAQGRAVWLGTCEGCHGYGTAGAPVPMQPDAWRPRLQQPLPVLYQHAIGGFFGPDDTHMPPRGGNDKLNDEQVKSAVDYMTALARYYIAQAR